MLISMENVIIRQRVGDEKAVDMLKEAGFTGIDYSLCLMDDWEETVNAPDSLKTAAALRRYAEERGMCFSQSHAPLRFRYGNKMDLSEKDYYRIVKSMEFAAALGAPMIVVHTVRPTDGTDAMDYNLRYFRSLLPYAEKFGIKIGVENLYGAVNTSEAMKRATLGMPEAFCEIQDKLSSPYITGCLDIGHANLSYRNAPEFIRRSAGHFEYLHVHDNDSVKDMHQIPAVSRYFGRDKDWDVRCKTKDHPSPSLTYTVPWDEVTEALREVSYSGSMNLEILQYASIFPTEMLPGALRLAADAAKMLAGALKA